MSYSQHDLGKRFRNGETTGKASNVEIVERDGETLLVGYGWAVYAVRSEKGEITFFDGWDGYSMSTTCQLTKCGLRTHADETVNKQPTITNF